MIEPTYDKMLLSEVFSTAIMAGLIDKNQHHEKMVDFEVRGDLASLMQFAELMNESREVDEVLDMLELQVELKRKREWVGLTPQERDEINEQVYGSVPHYVAFHYAIEAKLKEKNT